METIKVACENEDNGIFNKILDIIEKIPIIGNFLKKILEKRYDINSLKSNSIFIFDNFERIAPYIEVVNNKGEFIKIENEYDILSKYNIVTSTIDELIEKYNMKVIILADDTIMIPNYIQNTFIFKLGCKRYTIKKSKTIFIDTWNKIIDSDERLQKYKEELNNIFEQINSIAQEAWELTINENVRILSKCVYNFIFFYLYLLENEYKFDEENNEILGIFYTNFIINITNISDNSNFFKEIKIGQNISEYTEHIINKNNSFYYDMLLYEAVDVMWYTKEFDYIKWKNLEQNYKYIMDSLKRIKEKYNYSYITKFNYKTKIIESGKEINFDILCKIIHYNDEISMNLAMEILEKSKITFEYLSNYKTSNIDFRKICYINDMISEYNITPILKNNIELLKLLFNMLESELDNFNENISIMQERQFSIMYDIEELSNLKEIYFINSK